MKTDWYKITLASVISLVVGWASGMVTMGLLRLKDIIR